MTDLPEPANRLYEQQEKIEGYIREGSSANTRRAYRSDIAHFEETWQGLLPASVGTVQAYLADYADQLSVATLNRRLVALSLWHKAQGFSDPTTHEAIKKLMRGIRRVHNRAPAQVRPFSYRDLEQVARHLEGKINAAVDSGIVTADQERVWLKAHRDLAMILVGFWRGFRADSLCHLKTGFIKPIHRRVSGKNVAGVSIFLPASKGDRQARGETFEMMAMPELCPVTALNNWVSAAGLEDQQSWLFCRFRGGSLTEEPLSPGSMCHWIKRLCVEAGLPDARAYGSHSLRRGLANLMRDQGADVKTLMDYIGWKSADTALRYLESGSRGAELLVNME